MKPPSWLRLISEKPFYFGNEFCIVLYIVFTIYLPIIHPMWSLEVTLSMLEDYLTNLVVQRCVSTQTFPFIELILGVVAIKTSNGEAAEGVLFITRIFLKLLLPRLRTRRHQFIVRLLDRAASRTSYVWNDKTEWVIIWQQNWIGFNLSQVLCGGEGCYHIKLQLTLLTKWKYKWLDPT